MKLYEIAHSGAGDKGNISTLSVVSYNEADYEMSNIASLLFVCHSTLLSGATTSLAMDTHGKALSYALLDMEV